MLRIGDGIERGDIIEARWKLKRRYCGYYTDPCMRSKELRDYEELYRKKQPLLTKALKRLEVRGLVKLIRHGRYVKYIELTPEGQAITEQLVKSENPAISAKQYHKKVISHSTGEPDAAGTSA